MHVKAHSAYTAAMDYDYNAPTLTQPTQEQIKLARTTAGHAQIAAAKLVYRTDSARWREWERRGSTGRVMGLDTWELYLIKSGLRTLK